MGRALGAICISFSRYVYSELGGDPVLSDSRFGFTGIP